MHIEELRRYCLSKKDTAETLPFGPNTLVFKVNGKVFLLTGLDSHPLQFNVKCDPDKAIEFREEYPQTVLPGYHMNKKHWNTVCFDGSLNDDFIKELTIHSYECVVNSLPKKWRLEIDKNKQ